MAELEDKVAAHYTTDALYDRILAAVAAAGGDPAAPRAEDLKGVDEFHTGGLLATEALLAQLTIAPETRVIDIGSGIGGTARHIALATGASVTGFDLTPDYVETATRLSALVGLDGQTSYITGSALDMPLADGAADLATMFHVGMNIADKPRLFYEAMRVLAPGGTFALFDVMQTGAGDIPFPVPWAEEAGFSHVAAPDVYRAAAEAAGFESVAERARGDFALEFFRNVFAAIEKAGAPPPVGIHLLMRETAGQKIQNYVAAVEAGTIAPVEMIFRRP